ncbi:hypothetical protein SASPL_107651 [Salvia splendens]|uniref:Uncharacterized protein n=1 Tax=Salvia splendens TaxID=180675 RepID=A0A8X9A7H6_SALSN|nr:hypothetical protein SASPL_107651 [Salvia splendens]
MYQRELSSAQFVQSESELSPATATTGLSAAAEHAPRREGDWAVGGGRCVPLLRRNGAGVGRAEQLEILLRYSVGELASAWPASPPPQHTPVLPLKASSAGLFVEMTVVVNKLQPSQLAEEQRNATRLFKQLHKEIQTTLIITDLITETDVPCAMERVLAFNRA